jgi:hypothetical protein
MLGISSARLTLDRHLAFPHMAVSSVIKTERPSAAGSEPRRGTAWRMRQAPKLFPYGRRYGRDLR